MQTRFADFNLAQAVRELRPARVFLRRRDPVLRGVLQALLPDDACAFVEIADAALLLREVSGSLLSWDPAQTLEITMADRDSGGGSRDVLVGFRRPGWQPGAILITALRRDADGNDEEYGSALVLGPGVSIALAGSTATGGSPGDKTARPPARRLKLAS